VAFLEVRPFVPVWTGDDVWLAVVIEIAEVGAFAPEFVAEPGLLEGVEQIIFCKAGDTAGKERRENERGICSCLISVSNRLSGQAGWLVGSGVQGSSKVRRKCLKTQEFRSSSSSSSFSSSSVSRAFEDEEEDDLHPGRRF